MAKQTDSQEMEMVDVRLKIPRFKRDKLKLLSVLEKASMNSLLEKAIDTMIAQNELLKKLESDDSKKKRYSLRGLISGSTFTDADIDEARKGWEE